MKEYAYCVAVVFCYIIRNGRVLLIKRSKPPSFNEYTVVGGKKELGEDLVSACKREVLEETNLDLNHLNLRGVVNFHMEGRDFETLGFYFESRDFNGELKSNDEGELEWCDIEDSFHKEGISDFYLMISPFVFHQDGPFLGSINIDKQGAVIRADIR